MGAAALTVVAHVPEPRRSGPRETVAGEQKPATLLSAALEQTGISRTAVAEACGVSRQRVDAWACPDHDATPNLDHVRRMPASVRRAIGQQLLGGAQVVPVPRPLWDRALLRLLAHVSDMGRQIADAETDPKARAALLREIHAAREHLARLEAGVLATEGGR